MNSKLPKWELVDLYPSIESKELINDFSFLESKSQKFFDRFQGNVAQLTPSKFSEIDEQFASSKYMVLIFLELNDSVNIKLLL